MIIGAKNILDIVNRYLKVDPDGEVGYLQDMREIKEICDRWIDIQNNDGNIIDGSSMDNVVLKKQIHWDYNIMEGLKISCAYAPSSARASFIAAIQDDEEPTIPIEGVIEKSSIQMDIHTALKLANEIFKLKEEPKREKITIMQNSGPLYIEVMNGLHKIIEDQQVTIDSLVKRLSQ